LADRSLQNNQRMCLNVRKQNHSKPGTGQFQNLDLGSGKPTALKMEKVEIQVSADNLLGDYAKAFVSKCQHENTLRAGSVGLTPEEVMKYCEYLVFRRVQYVNGSVDGYGRLKSLAIPAFIQYCLENIGVVRIVDKGLYMVPVYKAKDIISFEEALAISDKIAQFEDETPILFDAMPRDQFGDPNVMTTALIADYVRGMEKSPPVTSYIVAFLGLKLVKENVYSSLFRVVYDDMEFIRSALMRQHSLFNR